MNQIPHRDWLPERARWGDTARVVPAIKFRQSPSGHESYLPQNIFRYSKTIFCDLSVKMKLENEKTDSSN